MLIILRFGRTGKVHEGFSRFDRKRTKGLRFELPDDAVQLFETGISDDELAGTVGLMVDGDFGP